MYFLLCNNYIRESISSISVQNHYESTRYKEHCVWPGADVGFTSKRGTDCTHRSQKGQQAAANACHGKPVPAIKGMQLELQIKHSKIFSGVKKKCLGMLFGRPKEILPVFIHVKLQLVQQDSKKENFRTNFFFSVQMISCHVNVPRSALQE